MTKKKNVKIFAIFWNSTFSESVGTGHKMQVEYISSDEEDVYMRSKPEEEEITDIRDLRSDLERFQQVLFC